MKKLLLILLCLPLMTLAQQTYVPDDNFENYLETYLMGNGIPNDDYVTTANINTVTHLDVQSFWFISDLTGIEDFTTLTYLNCGVNQLTSLDVSNNTGLATLNCYDNQLTSLDVSQNTALTTLHFKNNQLTSLDVSQNTALTFLDCGNNQLTNLDVSQNTALTHLACNYNLLTSLDVSSNTSLTDLGCDDNQLTSLDVSNGNNTNMYLNATNNPNLYCIDVDNPNWSTTNWTNIDSQHYFNNNCSGTAIEEHDTNKKLLRTIDVLGRETKNQPLFYIYDNGTVEKRIVIE